MAVHWGVDSLNAASTKIHVKGNPTLFDYVCDQAGRVPAFWGRYITELTFTKNGKKIKYPKLEKAEAEFIFNKSNGATRILPVYNLAWPGAHEVRRIRRKAKTMLAKRSAPPMFWEFRPACFCGAISSRAGKPRRPGIPVGGK